MPVAEEQSCVALVGKGERGRSSLLAFTQNHTIRSKEWLDTDTDDPTYIQVNITDQQTHSSDSHATIALGTDELLLDFGYSHTSDIVTDSSHKNWAGGLGFDSGVAATWIEDTYSEDSDSSSEFKLTLGGEDGFSLTNDHSYYIDIKATSEYLSSFDADPADDVDGDITGYIYTEIYRDYSDDHLPEDDDTCEEDCSDDNGSNADVDAGNTTVDAILRDETDQADERIHRRTETVLTGDEPEINLLSEKAPGANLPGEGRSLEDILAEYRDRRTQLERLQNRLEVETNEDMRGVLQHQITTEQNILEDLTEEALAAGATQEQLNEIDQEAAAAADEDPIELRFPAGNAWRRV